MLRVALLVAGSLLAACASDDVGQCCKVADGRSPDLIPVSELNANGDFVDDIARDPAFLCENFTCVAIQGAEAYCTKRCISDDTCPDGFSCTSVLQSDPGPGSAISPSDKFCVRTDNAAACEP